MRESLEAEDAELRSVALQNARAILEARERIEEELRAAKEELERKSDELNRSLAAMSATLESTTDGILVTDRDRHVTTYNRRFADLWGIEPDRKFFHHRDLVMHLAPKLKDPEQHLQRIEEIAEASVEESFDELFLSDGRILERLSRSQMIQNEVNGRVWSYRDVTQVRKVDEVKSYLAAIVGDSEDAIVSKTLNGIVTTWNSAAERMFGYSAEEMVGQELAIIIPSDQVLAEPEILARIRRGERIDHYETERFRKDGSRINVSITVSPIRDTRGRIIGASKIARDITKQKAIEADLQEEKRILESLNQTGPAFAQHLDLNDLLQVVTERATEVVGARFGAFYFKGTEAPNNPFVVATLSGGEREAFEELGLPGKTPLFDATFQGEAVVRADDITTDPRYGSALPQNSELKGRPAIRSYLAVPVVSRSHEVLGGLFFGHPEVARFSERSERLLHGISAQAAIALDNARLFEAANREIAERNRVEQALRDSEAQLRATFEQAAVGIAIADTKGCFTQINDRFATIVGFTREELLGTSFREITHREDLPATEVEIARLIKGEASDYRLEKRYVTKAGDPLWSLTSVTLLRDTHGNPLRFIGVIEDISDRKRAEEERHSLLESERAARMEAEKLGRLKDEFLATLSHELRTPLTSILGWSHLIRADVANSDRVREGIEVIERNARLQTDLVADLLDMNRIISGKMRLDVQMVELPAVIRAAIESIQPAAEAKGLKIETLLDPITEIINGDPARLQQIVWNLVSNAVKFTPRGGKVQVTLCRSGSHVEIAVADTGKGIDPSFIPHLFERFRQEDASSAREHGGLGIGLAIAKQLTDLHGGRITAASKGEGTGATFIVQLPISAMYLLKEGTEEQEHPSARRASRVEFDVPDLSGLSVLVIDDEPDARALLRMFLEDRGATVWTAGSAAEGLAILSERVPDVLVSDIGMPTVDGYALIREVRKKALNVPAAALTAFARSEDRTRAFLAGYNAHIPKPVEPYELLVTVASLANRTDSRA